MAGRVDVGTVLAVGAAGFLVFLAGALLMVTDTFPAGIIRDAHRAGGAVYERFFRPRDRYATDLWTPARTAERGVTMCRYDALHPGFTLYSSADDAHALLVDLQGDTLYRWQRPFSTVWDETSSVIRPVPDDHVYFRKAHVFPDGRLLALYEGVGDTPYGYGAVMLDADSQIVWRNLDNLHHDFDMTPDGHVVTLGHAFRHQPLDGADQFEPPVLEDFLVILDAQGRTITRLSLLDALNQSPFRALLWRIPYYSMADPLHANGVDYLDATKARWLARRLPMAREGQVLVSFREMAGGSLALVDPAAGSVVWASHGPWLAQHDPDVLPGGTIQVFDNRGNVGATSPSRILEVAPDTGAIVWSFAEAPAHQPLDSLIRASQQRLANGNTLITESSGGRLLEITRGGSVVWEYVNPVRGGAEDALIPVVTWAERVDPQTFTPAFTRRLTAAIERPGGGPCTGRDSE